MPMEPCGRILRMSEIAGNKFFLEGKGTEGNLGRGTSNLGVGFFVTFFAIKYAVEMCSPAF